MSRFVLVALHPRSKLLQLARKPGKQEVDLPNVPNAGSAHVNVGPMGPVTTISPAAHRSGAAQRRLIRSL